MKIASVLILEDDPFSLLTLKQALTGLNFEVLCATGSIPEAISSSRKLDIQVALLDLDLGPGANGIDVAHMLRQLKPNIGIILLTSYSDPRLANPNGPSLPPGAILLTKTQLRDFDTLINAILVARKYPVKNRAHMNSKLALTTRQIEVLKALASGLSTSEIAKSLGLSEKAVEGIITKLHNTLNLEKDRKFNMRIQLARAYFGLSGRIPRSE